MAEIQAPEDSVSFSDCANLEMSKFFLVMLPIGKKKKKTSLSVDAVGRCSQNDAKHQSLYNFCFILCAFFFNRI